MMQKARYHDSDPYDRFQRIADIAWQIRWLRKAQHDPDAHAAGIRKRLFALSRELGRLLRADQSRL